MQLRSKDLTAVVSTAGTPVATPNSRRVWMGFVNEGPNIIDLLWLDPRDGATITGRIRLLSGGSAWFSRDGEMPWDGAVSAVAYNADTTLAGIEVEEWG